MKQCTGLTSKGFFINALRKEDWLERRRVWLSG